VTVLLLVFSKIRLKHSFKAQDYFEKRKRYLSVILACLHYNCSSLNGDRFRVYIITFPLCIYGQGPENAYFVFVLFSKFDRQRSNLFNSYACFGKQRSFWGGQYVNS